MKKILLVEDEPSVISFIKKGLNEEGFDVSVALDGESTLIMVSEFNFDLIILDIMLPGISGLNVCKEIRAANKSVPILFLTALGTAENIVLGLNVGADDYLIKPFKFIELLARINSLLRRGEINNSAQTLDLKYIYSIDDLVVDDQSKSVTRSGNKISVTATEYRLLLFLLKNKNIAHSRVDLLENVWDINFNNGTNVVDVYVNYLRKKIDKESSPKLIHTIVGMGYILKIDNETSD